MWPLRLYAVGRRTRLPLRGLSIATSMKYEPLLDHTRLIETIRTEYRLPAEMLTFVPVGFARVCYVVDGAVGQVSNLSD